ncbi:Hint domain-containing protein [Acidocella sp.]|uniref:Hint domain-containing protein n=1 Tax=Acidocella sp. TaxID=50710 RepID=UPI00261178EF|nr:Hint domain-containing protein [Acidocella sp.]
MAHKGYTDTNANGVKYALTYENATQSYTLVITYPASDGSSPTTITGIPPGNVLTSDGGTLTITSLVAGSTYVIPPGITGNISITASLLSTPNTVYVGGTATISSTISAISGLVIHDDGGSITAANGLLAGALSGMTVDIRDGGSFTNGSSVLSVLNGTTINFGANGGTFIANAGGAALNLSGIAINGFSNGSDKIEFENLSASLASYSVVTSGSSQTITLFDASGAKIGSATVAGTSLNTGTFTSGHNGPLTVTESTSGSGFDITLGASPAIVPCFLGHTLIATPDGEKRIDQLSVGDMILTDQGDTVPVRWIGRRTVSTRFSDPLRLMPVRICAGALGNHLPTRDLLISPDHAVLIDERLVNAGALVNGETILREPWMPETFVYYHIEVEKHDLLLAEGVPAETFIDNIDRMAFDNWAEHAEIIGDAAAITEMDYPRVKSARQLPQVIRAKLEAQIPKGDREAA